MRKKILFGLLLFLFLGGGFWIIFGSKNYTSGLEDNVLATTTLSGYATPLESDTSLERNTLSNLEGNILLDYDTALSGYASTLDIASTGNAIVSSGDATPLESNSRDDTLLSTTDAVHNASDQEVVYEIDQNTISSLLTASQSFDDFFHKLRITILKFMIDNGYKDFNDQPYQRNGNLAIIAQSGDFHVLKNIEANDALDVFLEDKLTGFQDNFFDVQQYGKYLGFKPITISTGEYAQLQNIFLFKNEQDLRDLGYELISWKTRTNTDPDYRRYNISTAFYNIGNVRLILSDEVFSLAHEFHYSASDGKRVYTYGYATIGGVPKKIYGGGLCGVATALFQGSLTNIGLPLVEYKAHSIYYKNLYEAEINGITISQPGLDATIYAPDIDFRMQNIREYPIVVIFNYDGEMGTIEQVFTLSKAQDRGTFAFVGEYRDGGSKCFTWNINGEDMTNCYSKVVNF
ncbi:MAG: VanW family protein [Candidatus Absconditabacterales bacterium]